MKIRDGLKLDFEDVRIVPQRSTLSSRKDVSLDREFRFYHSPRKWIGVPVMSSNMVPLATLEMAKALNKHKMICVLHKYYTKEELTSILEQTDMHYTWVSIGKNQGDLKKIEDLRVFKNKSDLTHYNPNIVIDVPNGYMESFVKFCADVRNSFPNSIICAGNVTTPEMTQELIIHGGVDIVKLQIGPGSMCQTRKVTGVGYGTLSAVDECAMSSHGLINGDGRLGLVCSDGGCREIGDINKAMVAGADFVMLGKMFAATDQCEGEWEHNHVLRKEEEVVDDDFYGQFKQVKKAMKFYGMSSHYSQEIHGGGKKEYRASEGKVEYVPYQGDVNDIIQEIKGGIVSCCSYIGARQLRDMKLCGEFVRVPR
jgi:GMP reductase